MSLMMNLEIESKCERKEVLSALSDCGASINEDTSDVVTGNFPESNMYFVLKEGAEPEQVVAEQVPYPISWTVGARVTFHCPISTYDECRTQLRGILENLSKLSRAYFVLSFQYENVHALRDENGLNFLQKF